jgi:hypothetical protein
MPEPPDAIRNPFGCRVTLAGCLIAIGLVIAGAAILLVSVASAIENSNRACCIWHLSQLYEAMHVYASEFGNGREYMPHASDAFFACLLGHKAVEHPDAYASKSPCAGNLDIYVCPSSGSDVTSVVPGGPMTDYRGPARHPAVPPGNPSALTGGIPSGYPIACDEPRNHKGAGGNILRFDGSVRFVEDSEYTDAYKQCSD